jgi:hypothetical protein
MARLNNKKELWSHLTQVQAVRDATGTFGSTSLTAAAAAGAVSLTVAAITNFAVGQTIRVGAGETAEFVRIHGSTAPVGTTITLDNATPLQFAHAIGDATVQQALTDPGHIDDGGLTISFRGNVDDVNSAVQRMLFAQQTGYLDIAIAFGLLGYNVENLALAHGMLESNILGAGTTAQPRVLRMDASKFGEQLDAGWVFTGARKDGKTVRITAMGCEMDLAGLSFQLARGSKLALPVKAKVFAGVLYESW